MVDSMLVPPLPPEVPTNDDKLRGEWKKGDGKNMVEYEKQVDKCHLFS